jgi:hypothetical protein
MKDTMIEDLPVGETVELEKGLIVERRSFIKTVAMSLGAISLPFVSKAQTAKLQNEALTYEQFLQEVVPIAKKLMANSSLVGQNRYLLTLASFAVQLDDVPIPKMRDSGQGAGPGTFIGVNEAPDAPFTVLHWKMEPNTVIRTHAHTYGNVVTLGLEGEVRVTNYEMVGGKDFSSGKKFIVRKTIDQILTTGKTNLVNLEANYIHGSQAGAKGGRGLDITTRIKEKQPTPYLDLAKRALDEANQVYEASWIV